MSLAVAIAVDWVGDALPPTGTVELAIRSLIEKGIKPSYPQDGMPGWVNGTKQLEPGLQRRNDSGRYNNC
jgi:hypothetical protein